MKRVLPMLLLAGLAACGSPPPPKEGPSLAGSVRPAVPPPTAAPTADPEAEPPGPEKIPMYPVLRIYSLLDMTVTSGGIELRMGYDPGGGVLGRFRYVPLVNGLPDLSQETEEMMHATTTAGFIEVAGKRPDLVYHVLSGFRSAPSDRYFRLDAENHWDLFDPGGAGWLGAGMRPWSKDRLLEMRVPQSEAVMMEYPKLNPLRMRVVSGADKTAPSTPKSLENRLAKEGFYGEAFVTLRAGEVVVVGKLLNELGFGTLVWTDNLKEPQYFVTVPESKDLLEVEILGGDSLATLRLRANDKVMKLENSAWVVESTVNEKGLPDVWFGSPMVRETPEGPFARLAAGEPWRLVDLPGGGPAMEHSFAVDAAGVIWENQGDLLVSSKEPVERPKDVTEEDIVNRHKASILGGGAYDATGEEPNPYAQRKCRMHYVPLARSSEKSADKTDYQSIRKVLAGHTELAGARFVVSKERGQVFFGAMIKDEDLARKLGKLMLKDKKAGAPDPLCAEPIVDREIKIQLTTGEVIK